MCISPIYIWNNSIDVHGDTARVRIPVPCGKCEECLAVRHTSYKVRCYFECLENQHYNGVCVFDTLTYRDECLPKVHGFACFNHDDIVKFRKRLSITLERHGFPVFSHGDGRQMLRSFIVSEYGGTTHRPHYHLIVWYHNKGLSARQLRDFIHQCWTYGFTDKIVKTIDIRDGGIGAIHYVTKYMQKDGSELADLDTFNKCVVNDLKCSYSEYEQTVKACKSRFKLRCFTSNGLGSYFEKIYLDTPEHLQDFINHNGMVKIPNASGSYSVVPLPQYYAHRVLFDRVYNEHTGRKDRFVPNDLNKELHLVRYVDLVNKTRDLLQDAFAYCDKKEAVKRLMHGFGFRELAVYSLVYYQRVCYTYLDEVDLFDGFERYKDIICSKHDTVNMLLDPELGSAYKNVFVQSMLSKQNGLFADLDKALAELMDAQKVRKREYVEELKRKRDAYNALRSIKNKCTRIV